MAVLIFMSNRRLSTLVILCLTILSADLLSEVIVHWSARWLHTTNPYKTTAIEMASKVVVFYPAFQLMEEVVKRMTGKYVGKTKSAAGGGFLGLLIAFLVALGLLFGFYLKVEHNINLFNRLF